MTFLFYALLIGGYLYAIKTNGRQRHRWLMHFFTIVFIVGTAGFLWEVGQRGGRLPIAW